MGGMEAVRGETFLMGTHHAAGNHFLMFAQVHAAEMTQVVLAAITALEAQNGGC